MTCYDTDYMLQHGHVPSTSMLLQGVHRCYGSKTH
jgi:hypothetical protein